MVKILRILNIEMFMIMGCKVNLNTGDLIIFPSNFMYPHSVEPIISGTRYSIVCWFS